MEALVPVGLVIFVCGFFFSIRKDKKTKIRVAKTPFFGSLIIFGVFWEFGHSSDPAGDIIPVTVVILVSGLWLLALKTQ